MPDMTNLSLTDKLTLLLDANWEMLDDLQKSTLTYMRSGFLMWAAEDLELASKRLPERTEAPDQNMVDRPSHYAKWKLEPTKWAREYGVNWNIANSVKYILRYKDKFKPKEDVLKAARYLRMEHRFQRGEPGWSQ